jgi:hypothetical protein
VLEILCRLFRKKVMGAMVEKRANPLMMSNWFKDREDILLTEG